MSPVDYTNETKDQKHFTVSEIAADWHEQTVLQYIMQLSIARINEQLDKRCSQQTFHPLPHLATLGLLVVCGLCHWAGILPCHTVNLETHTE